LDNDTQRFAGHEAANPVAIKGFAGLIGSVASVRNERAPDVIGHRLVIGFEPAHKTRRSRNGMTVAA
jgi:hypothetical protein